MGVSVFAEEAHVEKRLTSLLGKVKWQAGLIIGTVTPKRHFAVSLIATPIDDESNGSGFVGLDKDWVTLHAEQVRQALPGGLDIIGMYIFCPGSAEYTSHLRQLLYSVCGPARQSRDQANDVDQFQEGSTVMDRVSLHMCSASKKITCRTYNVRDSTASAKPAEWKYKSFLSKWQQVSCMFNADLDVPVLREAGQRTRTTLDQTIRAALAPQFAAISNAYMAFNPILEGGVCSVDSDESVIPENATSARLFTALHTRPSTSALAAVIGSLKLHGSVSGLAFVPPKSSVGVTKSALKTDLIRTLWARCSAVCDTLDDDLRNYELKSDASGGDAPTDLSAPPKQTPSGTPVPNSAVALPIRLRVPFADSLFLSDYVAVEDDTEEYTDSIERMGAIFGLTITSADVSPLESFSTSLESLTPPPVDADGTASAVDKHTLTHSDSRHNQILLLGAAAFVVLLAVLYQFLSQ
eukprot:m.177456 g.177456  ORF g.177456 m.177456 type:complete len:466 (-) comp18368_c0_seq1:46-1443(-)